MQAFAQTPDLSHLTTEERQSIEMACLEDKVMNGPAAYNECLRKELSLLKEHIMDSVSPPKVTATPTNPDLPEKKDTFRKVGVSKPRFDWPAWKGGIPEKRPNVSSEKALDPVAIFKRAAPSVYVVLAGASKKDLLEGNNLGQGSAVAISKSRLITNCHIFEDRPFIIIVQKGFTTEVRMEKADPNTDRCVLALNQTVLNPINGVRPWASLEVGEKVYSIGAPRGLEQTLGEGLISGLREFKGMHIIQTTAPISPGSSGGGLFDKNGNLVGITTFLFRQSQAMTFALLAEMYWE